MTKEHREKLNAEMNNYIFRVLTTKYKKDDREAFDIVSADYKISKWDGAFNVEDLYICDCGGCYRLGGCTNPTFKNHLDEFKKIDFVRLLSDPHKETRKAYREQKWREEQKESPAINKYNNLKSIEYWIASDDKKIEKTRKEIHNLLGELELKTRSKAKREAELEMKRKAYGLS